MYKESVHITISKANVGPRKNNKNKFQKNSQLKPIFVRTKASVEMKGCWMIFLLVQLPINRR